MVYIQSIGLESVKNDKNNVNIVTFMGILE